MDIVEYAYHPGEMTRKVADLYHAEEDSKIIAGFRMVRKQAEYDVCRHQRSPDEGHLPGKDPAVLIIALDELCDVRRHDQHHGSAGEHIEIL